MVHIIYNGTAGQKLKELIALANRQQFKHAMFFAELKKGIWRLKVTLY